MPDTLRRPVVLDTTVLSNFASVESVEWLVDFLDDPVVPPAVEEEIERGRRHGHSFLSDVTDVLGDELIRVTPNETTTRSIIRERLDPGEAESLVLAVEQDGTLATDDLAARELAREHDVPERDRSVCSSPESRATG